MNTHSTELVRKGRKVEQVLRGAHDVFMAEGYEGANVDAIAKAAGVSKATLYSYFPDKRTLFGAVAQVACEEQTRRSMSFADGDGDFAEKLFKGCRSFLDFMCSPFFLQMFRTVVAESARFPEFGREFWASGPQMAHNELMSIIAQAEAEGELKPIEDRQLAAETLSELCKVRLHPLLLLGVIDSASEEEKDRVARNAVDMFMAHYGS